MDQMNIASPRQTTTGMETQDSLAEQVPAELLELIFNSVPASFPTANPAAAVSPIFALTGVCSRWRNIALSTPELWANIHLRLPMGLAGEGRIVTTMWRIVKVCVVRSTGRPLVLTLDERLHPPGIVPGLCRAGVSLDRVVEITACARAMNAILYESLADGTSLQLLALRRMFVIASQSSGMGEQVKKCQLPMVEHFEMTNVRFSEDFPHPIFLPWDLLTDLDITIAHGHFILKFVHWWVLGSASKLRHLRICAPFSYPPGSPLPSSLVTRELPSLKSLSLLAPHSTIWFILRELELPSLDRLHLSELPEEHDPQRDTNFIQHFFAHRPLLQHLSTHRLDAQLALRLVEICMPPTVTLTHSFSGNHDIGTIACQLVQDIAAGKATVAHVRELTLRDISRRPLFGARFLKDLMEMLGGWVKSCGGAGDSGHPSKTTIAIYSVSPQAKGIVPPPAIVEALAIRGVSLRILAE